MTEERLDIETEVRELFIAKITEFVAFCKTMQITPDDREQEEWAMELDENYVIGYNAALEEGVKMALELWT